MQSMTAFSRVQLIRDSNELTWEIKTVNHRYLDVFFSLPEPLRYLEAELRNILAKSLSRGRVEVVLQVKSQCNKVVPKLNEALLDNILQLSNTIASKYQIQNDVTVSSCLTLPHIWELGKEKLANDLTEQCIESFNQALQEIVAARSKEGAVIKGLLIDKAEQIKQYVQLIRSDLQDAPNRMRDKLLAKAALIIPGLDNARFEQEIAAQLMRLDISEELDRLENHLHETVNALGQMGMGRRLNFLVQELHREVNTISAKNDLISVSNYSIEIKVLIEQMREQIQNVE